MILQNYVFEAYIWTESLSSSFAEITKNQIGYFLSLSLSQYNFLLFKKPDFIFWLFAVFQVTTTIYYTKVLPLQRNYSRLFKKKF